MPQSTTALRTSAAIKLDGRLDENDWRRAAPLDRFFETFPGDRTTCAGADLRSGCSTSDRFLYVGVRL